MTIPKKYFHDRAILLLLTANIFFTLLTVVWVLLRLSSGHGSSYIVQCRDCSSQAIDKFKSGSVVDLLAFIVFAFLVLGAHTVLSLRTYHIHRQLAVAVLAMSLVLLILTIVVSNALLVLR